MDRTMRGRPLLKRLRRTLGGLGKTRAELNGTTVHGYRYDRSDRYGGATYAVALPGYLADEPEGKYFMQLYPDEGPIGEVGDTLVIDGVQYRVLSVKRVLDAYTTYRLRY